MTFIKKILFALSMFFAVGLLFFFVITRSIPSFEPCAAFEFHFGLDTINFPIEGAHAKLKFEGMNYDSLPPHFLYAFRGDTLIRALFRAGYDSGRFAYSGEDIDTTFYHKGGYGTNYDSKGIYAYSYIFASKAFGDTRKKFGQKFGIMPDPRISYNYQTPYFVWTIGPCHHLLLFQKKPFLNYLGLKMTLEYTYVMFVYNVSEKEMDDIVEVEGTIRNDFL